VKCCKHNSHQRVVRDLVRYMTDALLTNVRNTANLYALDVSKGFDKMNHHGLFIKLMNRCLPLAVLSMLENWFSRCFSFVKWFGSCLFSFNLTCGIRPIYTPDFGTVLH
jgi:hypothetical protein